MFSLVKLIFYYHVNFVTVGSEILSLESEYDLEASRVSTPTECRARSRNEDSSLPISPKFRVNFVW
jgi:hypothetical protein